nr:hypothetical protein [Tanacetum cinerariifolium]
MGTLRETLTEGTEGALHLGPERPRVYFDLTSKEMDRFITAVKLNRGLRDSNYDQLYAYLKQHEGQQNRGHGNNARGAGATGYGGAQNRVGYANPEYFKDKMLLMQAQKNRVTYDEEQLLFIAGGQDNVVDDDVDEQPTQDLELNVDNVFQADDCDAFNSDEQVELYERRARFELTEREKKIDEQLRIVITDHNIKEENLKKELHYVKMQLASTINHNKLMVEEVTSLKKDFKQKENQYLEEFLDMKALKEKVEDKLSNKTSLFKQCTCSVNQNLTMMNKERQPLATRASYVSPVQSKKCDEIERKNLLIANDTLIANCLSKEVFYIATNFELNVSIFSKMHEAYIVVQARCLELETELYKLKDKIKKDDHDVMVKCFSNLEVKYLYLQLIYQHLKEDLGNNNSLPAQDDSVTPKVLVPDMYAIDVEPIFLRLRNNRQVHLDYLKHLKESVATLREIVEEAKVERPLDRSVASAFLYTKHSQELLEYMIDTCPKEFNKRDKKQ